MPDVNLTATPSGRDLLENFETWPKHIQDSFLQMVSYQVIAQQELERAANLSLLDIASDEFTATTRVCSDKTQALVDELQSSADTRKFLQEMADRDVLLNLINRLEEQLETLKALLLQV